MPWHRVTTDHWSNNNDRHIFFDRLTKSVTTEYWSTAPGVGLVDIPLDTLREFLKDNGYLYDTTKGLTDYDFVNKNVQFDEDPNNVASGEATILFAGRTTFLVAWDFVL